MDKRGKQVGGPTHSFAPRQAGGMELLNVSLQLRPYTQVSFDPVHMLLIPGGRYMELVTADM